MNHTPSDSQLEEMIKSAVNSSGPLPPDEKFSQLVSALRELQERRKAEKDSEPVAYAVSNDFWNQGNHKQHIDGKQCDLFFPGDVYHGEKFEPDDYDYVFPLYRHAQPAPDREQVRREHAEWSQATFGNVGPVGPLKHLAKEAMEAAAEPDDLSEWADMQFLLWDAQRRAGITEEQITQAMIDKLAVNKQREWPEPKDGEPRLHIKEQQAPVVEREPIAWLNDAYLARGVVDGEAGSEDAGPGYIPVYREAGPRPAPVVTFYRDGIEAAAKWVDKLRETYDSEHGWSDPDTGVFEFGNDAQREYSSTLEELAEGIRALHPNAGNYPVIGIDMASGTGRSVEVRYVAPPGYVMVPKEPTAEMLAAAKEWFGLTATDEGVYEKMLEAAPQEVK